MSGPPQRGAPRIVPTPRRLGSPANIQLAGGTWTPGPELLGSQRPAAHPHPAAGKSGATLSSWSCGSWPLCCVGQGRSRHTQLFKSCQNPAEGRASGPTGIRALGPAEPIAPTSGHGGTGSDTLGWLSSSPSSMSPRPLTTGSLRL